MNLAAWDIESLYKNSPDRTLTCASFIYGHAELDVKQMLCVRAYVRARVHVCEFPHTFLKMKLSYFSFKLKLVNNTISMETLEGL